jgi:hypothetical protein
MPSLTFLDKLCAYFYCATNLTPTDYLAGLFTTKATGACQAIRSINLAFKVAAI